MKQLALYFISPVQHNCSLSCHASQGQLSRLATGTWHAKFVARRAEMVLLQSGGLYNWEGQLHSEVKFDRFLVKPPIQEPTHVPPPLPTRPNISYVAMITLHHLSRYMYGMGDIHCSPHTTYDKRARSFTLGPGHTGLHAAFLVEPSPEKMKAWRAEYFWKPALLIGGDVTRDGELWVAIVPVLPDTGTDGAFHEIRTQSPELTKDCITRSMLIDHLASEAPYLLFQILVSRKWNGRQVKRFWTKDIRTQKLYILLRTRVALN